MKVFLDCTFLRNKMTGVDVTFLSLIDEISQQDTINNYTVYIDARFDDSKLKSKLHNNQNFTIKKIYSPLPLQVIYSSFIFPIILYLQKFDVYHNPYFFGPLVPVGRCKTIITVHDLYHRTIPHLTNKAIKIIFRIFSDTAIRKASNIIAISSETKENIINILNIPENKISLIYQSFNSNFSQIISDDSVFNSYNLKQKKVFLNVGTVLQHKALKEIVEVFAMLKKGKHLKEDFVLVSIGKISDKSYYESIIKIIIDSDLQNHIYIIGYVTDEQLKSFYEKCKYVIISSYNEGFGLPALEAFYFEKILIYRSIKSLEEVVLDAGIPFTSINDLMNILKQILFMNNYENNCLIMKGKDRLKFFDWKNTAELVIVLYQKIHFSSNSVSFIIMPFVVFMNLIFYIIQKSYL